MEAKFDSTNNERWGNPRCFINGLKLPKAYQKKKNGSLVRKYRLLRLGM